MEMGGGAKRKTFLMGEALRGSCDGWTGKEVWMEVLLRTLDCRMGGNLSIHKWKLVFQVFVLWFAEKMLVEMVTVRQNLVKYCQMDVEDLKHNEKITA